MSAVPRSLCAGDGTLHVPSDKASLMHAVEQVKAQAFEVTDQPELIQEDNSATSLLDWMQVDLSIPQHDSQEELATPHSEPQHDLLATQSNSQDDLLLAELDPHEAPSITTQADLQDNLLVPLQPEVQEDASIMQQ